MKAFSVAFCLIFTVLSFFVDSRLGFGWQVFHSVCGAAFWVCAPVHSPRTVASFTLAVPLHSPKACRYLSA